MAGVEVGGFLGSNFDGDKAIKQIIDAEKKKREPIVNKRFSSQMQQESWVALRTKLTDLNTAARNLYSPLYSPFRKTVSDSSDESLISIDNSKSDPNKLKNGDYPLTPKQMAGADHFRSDAMDQSEQITAHNFNIIYHGKEYPISFKGGSLSDLSTLLKSTIGEFADVDINDVGQGNQVLSIKGKNLGKKEKISFSGDLQELKKIGLLKNSDSKKKDLEITNRKGLSSNDLSRVLQNQKVVLQPADNIKKSLDIPESITKNSQLIIHLKTTKASESALNKAKSPEDTKNEMIQGFLDKIWVGDASLFGESLINTLANSENANTQTKKPEEKPSPFTPTVHQLTVLIDSNGKSIKKTVSYQESSKTQELMVSLDDGFMNNLEIQNLGKLALQIEKVELISDGDGSVIPKNPISKAQNAIVSYQGVDYERESNTIDDIIAGMNFTINGESLKPVTLKVTWDYDEIVKTISQFIIAYNNSMDFFKKLTQTDVDPSLLRDSASRPSLAELIALKKAAYDKLSEQDKKDAAFDGTLYTGYLASDSSVKSVRSKLQALTVSPYETQIGQQLMFLSQLGIKRPGIRDMNTSSQEDQENFHAGYLEFTKNDQDTLLSFLKNNYEAVQELFFKRTAGQLIYDKGLAVEINALLDKVVANNFRGEDKRVYPGLIQVKINSLDQEKGRYDKQLTDFDRRLKREEDQLKRQFSAVYRAQNQAKASQAQLAKLNSGN